MILYKKDTTNKIRSLEIKSEDGRLYQISGLLDGAKVTHEKECKPKNIGKSNQTSSQKQAELEAKALMDKKLSEGYFKTIEECKSEKVILPMLAKDYKKESHKIDWNNCYCQPKLDGMRAISLKDNNLISRKNKEIDTLSHLNEEINKLRKLGIEISDGEVYAHGVSFQDNMKLIKKYRPGETEKVCYHIYDQISDDEFEQRYFELAVIFKENIFHYLKLVPTYKIKSEEEMLEYHKQFLSEGYEGTIIRWGDEPYKINGRSSNLLKYKDFKDMDAEVIDIIPMDAYPEQGVVVCKGFKATPKMSHIEKEELLANKSKYIGKIANIRYFEETDEGLPRFPICIGFYEDR